MSRSPSFHVRLPVALHQQLSQMAADQRVSFNLLIVSLLAGAVGFKIEEDDR